MMDTVLSNIRWLGHDSFFLRMGGKSIVFDPFGAKETMTADIILVSHDHFDHCSPDDLKKFQGPETVVITEPQSAAKLSGDVRVMKPGETLRLNGISITAVPAYNMNKAFHPKSNQWLGFVVEADGVTLYHAGDTDLIPEMSDIRADIALLPVSGTYVMTWQEAVEAAKRIKPKVAIPMHYGAIVGSEEDAKSFARALSGVCEVKVLSS
ncbi:MAG: MBL fold metallo-hydrolase [Thermodesulfobacteriota bacterium]